MPRRSFTRFQALARFLAELKFTDKPKLAYGEGSSPAPFAIAMVQLALNGFGALPPKACLVEFGKMQAQMLTMGKLSDKSFQDLLACTSQLWSNPPQDSPIIKKWRSRGEDLGSIFTSPQAMAPLPVQNGSFRLRGSDRRSWKERGRKDTRKSRKRTSKSWKERKRKDARVRTSKARAAMGLILETESDNEWS